MKVSTITALLILSANLNWCQNFQPYKKRALRLVQGISFTQDDSTIFFTLPHKEYLRLKGDFTSPVPRLAIYTATQKNKTWSEPHLINFSGEYIDYEPTVSPNGRILFFNSQRPIGGLSVDKNNIWFSRKENGKWKKPINMSLLNETSLEVSYPTISNNNRLVYSKEVIIDNKSHYYLFETTFNEESTSKGSRINFPYFDLNSSDPCISKNGDYLIFAGFEFNKWQETCDLYISFFKNNSWTSPIPLKDLNSNGPDFSPTLSHDENWIYYRKNYTMIKVKLGKNIKALHKS